MIRSKQIYASSDHSAKLKAIREQLRESDIPDSRSTDTESHITSITDAIPRNSVQTYFGFVTGGVTPAAASADRLVSKLDANIQVHLPDYSIATDIEDTALRWLLQLFDLEPNDWRHRIFTTGATASNILGLACGRDFVVQEAARRKGLEDISVAKLGLLGALDAVSVNGIQILTTLPHSSLRKAASIVGLGRDAVIDVGDPDPRRLPLFSMKQLSSKIENKSMLSIVVVSCAEVNTGRFGTTGAMMKKIREVCDDYGAWLHVDGAFGLMARMVEQEKPLYPKICDGVDGIEMADSITGDGHKLLNVPYDCGFFFSKHPQLGFSVFQNSGAAYLASPSSEDGIISPLHMGIENSRRFRALPVYASLHAMGRRGYREMLMRQISLAIRIAKYIFAHEGYTLLPDIPRSDFSDIYVVVLFRAQNDLLNEKLTELINATREVYVSGTVWDNCNATRIAVANWEVDPGMDGNIVERVLDLVWREWNEEKTLVE